MNQPKPFHELGQKSVYALAEVVAARTANVVGSSLSGIIGRPGIHADFWKC
jgi:hypothetical protein